MDPPYSTHLEYSGREECIGELDAFTPAYFEAMDQVFGEAERILRDRRFIAVYCSDSFKKKRGFASLGATFFALLERRFRPVDHIAVVRGNRKLEQPNFHKAAAEENFFLRGFNHLLIFKKENAARRVEPESAPVEARDARGAHERQRGSGAIRERPNAERKGAAGARGHEHREA